MQVAKSGAELLNAAYNNRASAGATVPSLATVPQFAKKYPAFSEGQLRWALFNSESNGLRESGAIVRFGRRLLLNEERFFAWLLAGQQRRGQRPQGRQAQQ